MEQRFIFENVSCNLCGSKEYITIYPAEYEKITEKDIIQRFRSSGDEFLIDRLVKCSKCGLIFINPRIRSDIIITAYAEGEDKVFISQAEAREKTFFNALIKIEKFSKKGNILDVGTAGGSFLATAKKRGWKVYGCEPNKWLVEWGKNNYGIQINAGTIFEQKYPSEFFDVVTLWDVIEHTPDPSKVLIECRRVLKKGGILVVNYPDIGSWISRLLKKKWLFLISVHLYYFTRRTMNLLLKKSRFKRILVKPHFQRLELGYILFRAEAYNEALFRFLRLISNKLKLSRMSIPYWLGQTFVIAKKL